MFISSFLGLLLVVGLVAAIAALIYWLVVITEGVFLGRRMVVWLYDITAHKYDGIKEFDAGSEHYFVTKPYLRHLPPHPAPCLLDVATGTGRVPFYLFAEPTFNGKVVGVDASWRMLSLAAEKLAGYNGRFLPIQQVAANLPFADNTFHGVTCLEALEFFPSAEAALREMVRILKPGGSLMITRRTGWEAKAFVGRFHSPEAFTEMLTQLGFVDVEILPWQLDYDQVMARKLKSQ